MINQFVSACAKFSRMDYAIRAFTQMDDPNVFVYNAVIRACVCCGSPFKGLLCYLKMLRVQTTLIDLYSSLGKIFESRRVSDEMVERDVFVWTSTVSVLARSGEMVSARRLFDEMPERNFASWNSLIDGYARIKDVESAEYLFSKMHEKYLISWTTMINCYLQNKLYQEALATFDDMTSRGISPDEVTMATVISALIDGLAMHGYPNEALNMFTEMVEMNIKPNGVTFISVLSACTHAGMVKEGHVGLLEDALGMIRDMRMESNAVIWGALLGGCKLQKNLEIAQIAVNELTILEPDNSGYYTLLVNMFAEANRWSEVAKLRSAMKYLRVEKNSPGSSWIEIHGKIHQFSASDKYHESSKEIYFLLDELCGKLVLAPCVSEHIFGLASLELQIKTSCEKFESTDSVAIPLTGALEQTFLDDWKSPDYISTHTLQQNVMPAELEILVQISEDMLYNVKTTEAWIRGSKIIVFDYLPLVALRLVMMLSLICLQVSNVSKVILSLLTGEKSIVHLLPKKLVAKLQRRSGSCLNLNPEVVAEAFESVVDRLLIAYSGDRIPQIRALCAISVDLRKSR
nr:hypothetical protein [Tanacetum cinerariifolium]